MRLGSDDTIAFTRSNSPALIASMNAAVSDLVSLISRLKRKGRKKIKGRVAVFALFAIFALSAAPASAQLPERPPLGSAITIDALGVLPAPGNLFSLLDTAVPDVIADRIDTGGLSAGEPARVGAHGSTWTQTLFTLGDVNITDPGGSGTPLLLPGVDTWERAEVTTGLMPIDRSAPGVAITLTPRGPSNDWSSIFTATATPPGLSAQGDTGRRPSIARLNSWLQGNFVAGGPIAGKGAGVFTALTGTRSTHFERSSTEQIDSNLASAFVNLTAASPAVGDLRIVGWLQRSRDPVEGHAAFQQYNAGERQLALHTQAAWSYAFPNRD